MKKFLASIVVLTVAVSAYAQSDNQPEYVKKALEAAKKQKEAEDRFIQKALKIPKETSSDNKDKSPGSKEEACWGTNTATTVRVCQ
jgi:hypothetical protein